MLIGLRYHLIFTFSFCIDFKSLGISLVLSILLVEITETSFQEISDYTPPVHFTYSGLLSVLFSFGFSLIETSSSSKIRVELGPMMPFPRSP